jgi:hypothetical protein
MVEFEPVIEARMIGPQVNAHGSFPVPIDGRVTGDVGARTAWLVA